MRALEGLKRREASERSLKSLWSKTKSLAGTTISDSTRKKNMDELRDAMNTAERFESGQVELIRDVRTYLEETSLEIAANSAFQLMNLQTLEILLKEATTIGLTPGRAPAARKLIRHRLTVDDSQSRR